jgi:hypothetical protein
MEDRLMKKYKIINMYTGAIELGCYAKSRLGAILVYKMRVGNYVDRVIAVEVNA